MRYNLLGRTGLYVSELCLGTMTFGGKGYWEQIGRVPIDVVTDMMKTAFDAGINFYRHRQRLFLRLSRSSSPVRRSRSWAFPGTSW